MSIDPIAVFLSSPMDVKPERDRARAACLELQTEPSIRQRFRLDTYAYEDRVPPVIGETPQKTVDRYLLRPDDADVLVCILWNWKSCWPPRNNKSENARHEHPEPSETSTRENGLLGRYAARTVGSEPDPLESLLIQRVLAAWMRVHFADALAAQAQERQAAPSELRFLRKRQEPAGRCLTEAVKQLALARRVAKGKVPSDLGTPAARH